MKIKSIVKLQGLKDWQLINLLKGKLLENWMNSSFNRFGNRSF